MWEIDVHLAVARDVCDGVFLCSLFFLRDVLDEILDLIESVSESFPTYSYNKQTGAKLNQFQPKVLQMLSFLCSFMFFI